MFGYSALDLGLSVGSGVTPTRSFFTTEVGARRHVLLRMFVQLIKSIIDSRSERAHQVHSVTGPVAQGAPAGPFS